MEAVKTLELAPPNTLELARVGEGAGMLVVNVAFGKDDGETQSQPTPQYPEPNPNPGPDWIPEPRRSEENIPKRRLV